MKLELALEAPNFSGQTHERRFPFEPATGKVWLDLIWLSLIATLDQHVIPAITRHVFTIDLLAAWLIVTFVVAPPRTAIVAWIFGSLFMETASHAPKGLYLCANWIIMSVLLLTRKTLSWKTPLPWLVTFFLGIFFTCHFESIIIFIRQDSRQLDFMYFFDQALRVSATCLIGMTIANSWMKRFKGDSVKDRITL